MATAFYKKTLEQLANLEYSVSIMNAIKAYEEVVDFIAAGTTPKNVIAFRPSEAAQERVADLLHREKLSELTSTEKSELDHYMQLEHLMRMAKIFARKYTLAK